ncbi:hypothetical protein PGT21_029268 [Puccinia graminis f. sp. tritici]|uniref:PQ loop repeat-containing protein 2 n=1 Tax=Puccinia graminis f. sp. tritici TaxID=56615 RepID=A0A5B0QXK0_PUCGR|nr:hypothetical protein PGT21_029268 [Puccinia graminis f. sp. tritici]
MLVSDIFGNLSQLFWLFAQLPQIWTNYRNKSVEGLSLTFLLNWLSGDVTNLIGCLLTNQLVFQRNLAIYFNLIDLILIGQFALYSRTTTSTTTTTGTTTSSNNQTNQHAYAPISQTHLERSHPNHPIDIERSTTNSKLGLDLNHNNRHSDQSTIKAACPQLLHPAPHPSFQSNQLLNWNENSINNPSNTSYYTPSRFTRIIRCCHLKPLLFLAIVAFIGFQITTHHSSFSLGDHKSPDSFAQISRSTFGANNPTQNLSPTSEGVIEKTEREAQDTLEVIQETNKGEKPDSLKQKIGRLSAWLCAFLYLTSRIPQIMKNHSRKSVEGLSILLFVLAFLGNLTYVLSILSSPQILFNNPDDANKDHRKLDFLNEAIPYLIGSAGTLCFDLAIFIQSRLYRSHPTQPSPSSTLPDSPSITCSHLVNPSPPLLSPSTHPNQARLNPDPEIYAALPLLDSRSSTSLA